MATTGWGGRAHVNKRSMNLDLVQGMTDGSSKKSVRDRGGIVEGTSSEARANLSQYYQIEDLPIAAQHLPVAPFVKLRNGF